MKLDHFHTPRAKINSKYIKVLIVQILTVNILEENMEHCDFDLCNDFIETR
jgi:hypothetical protein